jgi:tetratricopeptide (TPR) repeat protein
MHRVATLFGWPLSLLPIRAELLNEIGIVSFRMGRPNVAAAFLSSALRRDPNLGIARYNLGLVSLHQGKLDRASSYFQEAIRLGALELESENNLGVVQLKRHNFHHARAQFLRVLPADPTHATAKTNLAHALGHIGSPDEALSHYEAVIRAHPDHVEAHFGAAVCYLRTGRWRQGWKEYEWRFERSERSKSDLAPPVPGAERWCGQPLIGKRILLRAEQGLGDTIQFCRFAAELTAAGARVFLAVQKPLVNLLRTLDGVESVCAIGREQRYAPLDFWSPLVSVPLWLNVSEESLPRRIPYLHPDRIALQRWSRRVGRDEKTF